MSSRTTRIAAAAALAIWAAEALAMEPCHRGVPAVDIEQGSFTKAPGYIDPDAETLQPNGKLLEQRWHNLHAAIRPLKVLCRYADKTIPVVLPNAIDTCVWEYDDRKLRCF